MQILNNAAAIAGAIDAAMDVGLDICNEYSRKPTKVMLWGYIAIGVAGAGYLAYQAVAPVVANGARQVGDIVGDGLVYVGNMLKSADETDSAEVVDLRQAA